MRQINLAIKILSLGVYVLSRYKMYSLHRESENNGQIKIYLLRLDLYATKLAHNHLKSINLVGDDINVIVLL